MTGIDAWAVAKAAQKARDKPRMDGTRTPSRERAAYVTGFAEAVEQLPSSLEIAERLADSGVFGFKWGQIRVTERGAYLTAADAVLDLIRERYEEVPNVVE